MQVLVDTREQRPWTFEGLGITTARKTLDTGDYSLPGCEQRVTIERKSLDDFVSTVMTGRSRFYKELDRMRAFPFRCVIIEAGPREVMTGDYRSRVNPASVIGFVAEVSVQQSVPVYLAGSRAEAQILAAAILKACRKKFPLV